MTSIYEMKEMNLNNILINYTNDRTEFNEKVKELKDIKKRINNNESKKKKLIF